MSPERLGQIRKLAERQWDLNSRNFEKQKQIILFDEASKLMFQVACKWAGVPLKKAEAKKRAMDMSFMIDAFGAAGPRHWRGRCARNCSENFARRIIEEVRSGRINAAKDTALHSIAWYKDEYNELLTPKEAAVELINILRPITAIATYITFGALALYRYPECKEKLIPKDDAYLTMFAQEIRRFYPFGPFLGARVRNNFQWYHHKFKKGDLVFLDIYGTNHDKSTWVEPDLFRPERFANHTENPFDFIPQGGGDYKTGTRCPGEWLTIDLLKVSINFLTNKLKYQVPLQDLTYPMNRIPTLPRSKFILSDIRKQPPN
jgi:fatty-acid peroxygenase